MVYIEIEEKESTVICNCHIGTKNRKQFRMIIDKKTKEFIEKPEYSINVSAAYSCIFHLLDSGKPLPKRTVAEWG